MAAGGPRCVVLQSILPVFVSDRLVAYTGPGEACGQRKIPP